MKNWKRVFALLLSFAMIFSLAACTVSINDPAGGTVPPSPDASQDPGAVPSMEVDLSRDVLDFSAGLSADNTLLTVNGAEVKADLFLYWLFWDCYYFESNYYYYGLAVADFTDMLLEDTVDMALYYTVLRQKAVELGCLPTDAQMQEIKTEMLNNGQEYYDDLKTSFGLSDGSVDYLSTLSYYYENLMDAMVPTATDEMLNSYVYQVKHILLKTVNDQNQPLSDDEIAAQKALADDILAQLQAVEGEERKELFDELMNRYSEDGRDENGGLYAPDGYTAVPGDMVTEFEEASLALPIGGMSGIVESSYGYHIILRGEAADPESYAEDCRAYQLDKELDALMETAEVTRAPALDTLDVADFYDRYIAYQDALYDQQDGVG